MSSREYATPLRLDVRPSLRLYWLYRSVIATAIAGILLCALPVWGKLLVLLALIGALTPFRPPGLRDGYGPLIWHEGSRWSGVFLDEGNPVELEEDFVVSPSVLILNFRCGAKKRSIVMLADSLPAEQFRRLRVRLRLHQARGRRG